MSLFTTSDEGRKLDADGVRARREHGLELAEEYGIEVLSLHYCGSGSYDFVSVAEVPDSESLAKWTVAYERMGLATTEIFEVFDPEKWDSILEDALE